MILIIDNYDSFTFNLYQLIGEINSDIKVVRNDKLTIEYIRAMQPNVASIKYIIFKSMYILSLCIFFSYFSIFY